MPRLLKQFLYGIFYLAVFGGMAWGIYLWLLKSAPTCFDNRQNGSETGVDCGGPCVSCEVKNLKPISVGETELFSHNRVYSVSVEVKNPNDYFAASSFDYLVNFYDKSGAILQTVKNKSFLYPQETKPIIEAGVRITNGVPEKAKIEIDPKSVSWAKPDDFYKPIYELKDPSAYMENEQTVIGGAVFNPASFNVSKIIVNAFLIDKSGNRRGASKYEIKDLGKFETVLFKIIIPVDEGLIESVDLEATAKNLFIEALR